jgi:hypothetical protein
MNKRGIVAMLDGLLAYTVAFACIGMVLAILSQGQATGGRRTYELNVLAEDLADVIGSSMVNASDLSYSQAWLSNTSPEVREDLNKSLKELASQRGLAISVKVVSLDKGSSDWEYAVVRTIGDFDRVSEAATAQRFLLNVTPDYSLVDRQKDFISLLNVTVGI